VGALAVTQTRGETIQFSIVANGTTISVITPASCTSTICNFSSSELAAINTALAADGSGYQFINLTGISNFSGSPSLGALSLNGNIQFNGGNNMLQITETESGFTLPNSAPGTLTTSSGASFTNTLSGDFMTLHSSFNSILTPPVTLTSIGGSGTNGQNGGSSNGILGFSPPYTLDNSVSFSLNAPAGGSSTDSFVVGGTYRPAVSVVPEIDPTSAVAPLALLAGAVLVMRGRIKRSEKNFLS
jgi:hypothetical protein